MRALGTQSRGESASAPVLKELTVQWGETDTDPDAHGARHLAGCTCCGNSGERVTNPTAGGGSWVVFKQRLPEGDDG